MFPPALDVLPDRVPEGVPPEEHGVGAVVLNGHGERPQLVEDAAVVVLGRGVGLDLEGGPQRQVVVFQWGRVPEPKRIKV